MPSSETIKPFESEQPDHSPVLEWFRADAAPFGGLDHRLREPCDPAAHQPAPEASDRVLNVVERGRAAVTAAEQALAGSCDAPDGELKSKLDRLMRSISELECERERVEAALVILKELQRTRVS